MHFYEHLNNTYHLFRIDLLFNFHIYLQIFYCNIDSYIDHSHDTHNYLFQFLFLYFQVFDWKYLSF